MRLLRKPVAFAIASLTICVVIAPSASHSANAAAPACDGSDITFGYPGTTAEVHGLHTTGCTTLVIPSTATDPGSQTTVPVSAIYAEAFWNDTTLTSVSIPASVTSIGSRAFSGTTALQSVTFASGSQLQTIEYSAFSGAASLTSIVIPASVTTIEHGAFSGASSLTSIVIPANVTTIGHTAFKNNTSLTSLGFAPNSALTTIGAEAFMNTRFTVLAMPNSVATIGNRTFRENTALQSVTLSNSLTAIPEETFYGTTALTGFLTIPDSVVSIANRAFDGANLTGLQLGRSVATIGDSAFRANQSPGTMTGTLTIPDSVTRVGHGAFDFQGFTSLVLNEGLVTVDNVAFRFPNLTGSVTLPSTVRTLDDGAFADTKLTSLILNQGLETIGHDTFASMADLTGTLRIPSSVNTVGELIVNGANSLDQVYFEGNRPASLSTRAFASSNNVVSQARILFASGTSGWGDQGNCGDTIAIGVASAMGVCEPAPSSVSPSLLPSAGGRVSITGTKFMSESSVSLGGDPATNVQFVDSQTVNATLPAASAGTPSLILTNFGVRSGTLSDAVRYVPFDPVPSGVSAAPSDGSATVSWKMAVGAESEPGLSYRVTSSPDGKTCVATVMSCTVTGLTNGTNYTFRVQASTGNFTSAASEPSTAVKGEASTTAASSSSLDTVPRTSVAKPGRVSRLTIASVDTRSFSIRWKPPRGSATTGGMRFQVRLRIDGRWTPWTSRDVKRRSGLGERRWVSLVPRSRYIMQVRAVNAGGAGPTARLSVVTKSTTS